MNANVPIIEAGKATPQYQTQWRLRGLTAPNPVLAIPANLDLVNDDFTPTKAFMGLWLQAWGEPLPPHEPVSNPDGTPSQEHLERWP